MTTKKDLTAKHMQKCTNNHDKDKKTFENDTVLVAVI